MPRLSPTTESAKILKWYIQPKDTIESYQLFLRVETDTLLKDEDDRERTTHELDIEIIEEGSVVKLLVQEGDEQIEVDTPIALICDEEIFDKEELEKVDIRRLPVALWQAYAIAREGDPARCGTCD